MVYFEQKTTKYPWDFLEQVSCSAPCRCSFFYIRSQGTNHGLRPSFFSWWSQQYQPVLGHNYWWCNTLESMHILVSFKGVNLRFPFRMVMHMRRWPWVHVRLVGVCTSTAFLGHPDLQLLIPGHRVLLIIVKFVTTCYLWQAALLTLNTPLQKQEQKISR